MTSKADKLPLETEPVARDNNTILTLKPVDQTLSRLTQQPRSQGLSSQLPLVVGRKTLVAAGHMTTQNLGGEKICWVGGVAEYFVWFM